MQEKLKQRRMECRKRLFKCETCHCLVPEEQVKRCQRKFEYLDYYRNKIYCEKHFKPIEDRLDEKWRKSREKYKEINPSWYYGSGLYDTMKRLILIG